MPFTLYLPVRCGFIACPQVPTHDSGGLGEEHSLETSSDKRYEMGYEHMTLFLHFCYYFGLVGNRVRNIITSKRNIKQLEH